MGSKNATFKDQDIDKRSFENRQYALEAFKELCRELEICAACGTSAGLYLAGEAAMAIGFDRQGFVELATKVWDDLARQQAKGPDN